MIANAATPPKTPPIMPPIFPLFAKVRGPSSPVEPSGAMIPADPPVGVESSNEVVGCGRAWAGESVTMDGCALVSVSIGSWGLVSWVGPLDTAGAVKRAGVREDTMSDVGTASCSVSVLVGTEFRGRAEDTAATCEGRDRVTTATGEDTSNGA
jgi:hypothetical protein